MGWVESMTAGIGGGMCRGAAGGKENKEELLAMAESRRRRGERREGPRAD